MAAVLLINNILKCEIPHRKPHDVYKIRRSTTCNLPVWFSDSLHVATMTNFSVAFCILYLVSSTFNHIPECAADKFPSPNQCINTMH